MNAGYSCHYGIMAFETPGSLPRQKSVTLKGSFHKNIGSFGWLKDQDFKERCKLVLCISTPTSISISSSTISLETCQSEIDLVALINGDADVGDETMKRSS